MEFRINKREVVPHAILLLVLLAAYAFMDLSPLILVFAILLMIAVIAVAILPKKVVIGKPAVSDERLKKTAVYAAHYSWSLTFMLVGLAALATYANLLAMKTVDFAMLVFFCMGLTRMGYQVYFDRKGDVE